MKSILVVMSRFNMLIYIKYESGEGIILGMIKKDNVSKKDGREILFWSSSEAIVNSMTIMA